MMTNTDVANHLMETLGKRIRERNDRVFRVLRYQETTDPAEVAPAVPQESSNSSVGATVSGPAHVTPRQKPSQLGRIGGGMAAMALLAALGVVWINKSKLSASEAPNGAQQAQAALSATPPPTSAPTPAPAASLVTAPQPTRLVEISVAATPKHAEILLDGEKVGEGGFSRSTRPSHEPRLLEVRADNYITDKRDILFDRTQALTISLQKVTSRAAPRRATGKKPELPLVQQPGPRRTPRSLDDDNPFAAKKD
jgi:hypothetical protein